MKKQQTIPIDAYVSQLRADALYKKFRGWPENERLRRRMVRIAAKKLNAVRIGHRTWMFIDPYTHKLRDASTTKMVALASELVEGP